MSLVDHDPRSILHGDILTLLMVSCHCKNIPSIFIQMTESVGGARVWINVQISTISPQLHMCQTVCRGEITLLSKAQSVFFFFFFKLAKTAGCMVKIDHYTLVGGRDLSIPPLA